MSRVLTQLDQLEQAIKRFEEVLQEPKTDIVRDSAIKRFEFVTDITWKTLKLVLEDKHGVICSSPKSCFREAYRQGLAEYEDQWLQFLNLRNLTAHSYNEVTADDVYAHLNDVLSHAQKLLTVLKDQSE